jgi:replicative DNA helicase
MPILSDLRGSGSIEQDADTVTFFYRPNYYDINADANDCQVSVAKNRNGACEIFSLWVDIKNSTFLDDVRPNGYNNYEKLPIPMSNTAFFADKDLEIPF